MEESGVRLRRVFKSVLSRCVCSQCGLSASSLARTVSGGSLPVRSEEEELFRLYDEDSCRRLSCFFDGVEVIYRRHKHRGVSLFANGLSHDVANKIVRGMSHVGSDYEQSFSVSILGLVVEQVLCGAFNRSPPRVYFRE